MTFYESTQLMNNKIQVMYNTLYNILQEYNIEVDNSLTFTELVEKTEEIPTDDFYYAYNKKPINNIIFNYDDTLLRKEINIYYKIEFLIKFLKYVLLLKGVPPEFIKNVRTLREAIELLELIKELKNSVLTLDVQEYIYYYNSYCTIPYILLSEEEEIKEGYIVILEDDIEIGRIPAGEELKFLPTDIGTHTYTFYYEGSGLYRASTPQQYIFKILPAKVRIEVTATNIGASQYNGDHHIGYTEDKFEVQVKTINPYINIPASNVPFYIKVPQKVGYKTINGITDEDGVATITISSNKVDTFDIIIQTLSDSNKISNANDTYSLTIYHNPIQIDDYKFYEHQVDRNMEMFFYDNQGELTNQYFTNNYHITMNGTYRNLSLSNKSNPLLITETHTELGRYEYEYLLLDKNNKVIANTKNKVSINKEIKIKIVAENKFLTSSTKTIKVHIYTTDYQDQPLDLDCQFITSYTGLQDTIYSVSDGHYKATLNVEDIVGKCNGFLLQAVSVDDEDVLSNTIYFRINNEYELDTTLTIECDDTYNLNDTILDIGMYLVDEEGDDVCRTITITDGLHTYNLNYIYLNQNFFKSITLADEQIGDDITITVTYVGEEDHYLESMAQALITFIKSDITCVFSYDEATVYEESNVTVTCSIDGISKFNKYITGDMTITIGQDEYPMTRNNNIYTGSILPIQAGNVEVMEQYKGNKWTNYLTQYNIINVNKTDRYNFDVELSSDSVEYGHSIIFTPVLEGTTQVQQTFNGTITYQLADGTVTRNIEDYSHIALTPGEQSVTITYSGDNNHEPRIITKTFTVIQTTPTITLLHLDYDAICRSDVDYIHPIPIEITYTDNDECVPVHVLVDNQEVYYDTVGKETNTVYTTITTKGTHTITLITDATNKYKSITIEDTIETYDFVEELNDVVTAANNNTQYSSEYDITDDLDYIVDHMDTTTETNENIKERTNNVIVCMDIEYDMVIELTNLLQYYNYNTPYDDVYHLSDDFNNTIIKLLNEEITNTDFDNNLNEIINLLIMEQ